MPPQTSERQLALEVAAANILREALASITDDDIAIRDTIEGSTNLREAIEAVLVDITNDEILTAGIKVTLESLSARSARIEHRIDRRRAAIERAMEAGELQKLELPTATLSLRRVPPKIEIINEGELPPRFFVPQPSKLDRKALGDALKAGETFLGAKLGNGGMSLSVRRA